MIYEYQDIQTGARHEIHASMKSPPGEVELIDGRRCKRVYTPGGRPIVKDFAVKPSGRSKLPIARMLPGKYDGVTHIEDTPAGKVRHHNDGTRTDARGYRIIDGQAAFDLAKKTTGAEED